VHNFSQNFQMLSILCWSSCVSPPAFIHSVNLKTKTKYPNKHPVLPEI